MVKTTGYITQPLSGFHLSQRIAFLRYTLRGHNLRFLASLAGCNARHLERGLVILKQATGNGRSAPAKRRTKAKIVTAQGIYPVLYHNPLVYFSHAGLHPGFGLLQLRVRLQACIYPEEDSIFIQPMCSASQKQIAWQRKQPGVHYEPFWII